MLIIQLSICFIPFRKIDLQEKKNSTTFAPEIINCKK